MVRRHVIRGLFSFLAAAVTLAMAQEWAEWGLDQRDPRRLLAAYILVSFAMFEARQVWRRFELVFDLLGED